MKTIKGVKTIRVLMVTRKCGHTERLPITTSKRLLKKLVKTRCYECQPDTCLMH